MRQSRHIGKTLRETPKDAQTIAHSLMLRAGYIQQLSAGVYNYMPLLFRTLTKISQIVREEMAEAGAEELLMPALQPKELWVLYRDDKGFTQAKSADSMKGIQDLYNDGSHLGYLWIEGYFDVGDPLTHSGGPKMTKQIPLTLEKV